ncbi:unnamed protein product [Adineta steineri]|uniref:Uncharacterized protein n=1 Tax=Adineta steineri TaxID=433720 RepID=A0A813NC01_9BILA|nr:unnamed protein product [Adineta steineri]CAF3477065.1 unnamed protein product [Adineta steineri]
MRRQLSHLLIIIFHLQIYHTKILENCQFVKSFYDIHSNIFELNNNQTSLTVRPLYSLLNQSYSFMNQSLSIGIIYPFADTYLVPVPLVFQCSKNKEIYAPNDCEFTMIDTRTDLSIRRTEPTRTTTVSLHFQEYSQSNTFPLRGAYFKQSKIALQNCRIIISNETFLISNLFNLQIEFEQTIGSQCHENCSHSQLYECSSLSKTCQCRTHTIEKYGHLCVDTELASNCSLTPERCRRLCNIQKQIHTNEIDHNCQCPLGTRRILSNNIYHCELPILSECDTNLSRITCPKNSICQDNRCISISIPIRVQQSILPIPIILIGLLIGSLFIIIILILGLFKMRSVKCVKFVHQQHVLSTAHSGNSSPATITRLSTVHSSSSPCSTLSSSSKSVKLSSTNKILEKYTKIDIFE